jgi:hypothetical protein
LRVPFRLNWMGEETSAICRLVTPFHPLVLVSPVPRLHAALPGSMLLPESVSLAWSVDARQEPREELGASELRFDVLEFDDGDGPDSASYDFYFNVYLKQTAISDLDGTVQYSYVESLHRQILDGRFVTLARVLRGEETIAGCLLRNPTESEGIGYAEELGIELTEGRESIAIIDSFCWSREFDEGRVDRFIAPWIAAWARERGYRFLATAAGPPLNVASETIDGSWISEYRTVPVFHKIRSSLLYCDFMRCSYLKEDVYFYSCGEGSSTLHYIANGFPDTPKVLSFLASLTGTQKRVYARRDHTARELAEGGVQALRPGSPPGSWIAQGTGSPSG